MEYQEHSRSEEDSRLEGTRRKNPGGSQPCCSHWDLGPAISQPCFPALHLSWNTAFGLHTAVTCKVLGPHVQVADHRSPSATFPLPLSQSKSGGSFKDGHVRAILLTCTCCSGCQHGTASFPLCNLAKAIWNSYKFYFVSG